MTEGSNVYCDGCWARILDHGYVDRSDLCDDCREFVESVDDPGGELDLEVTLVERLIV